MEQKPLNPEQTEKFLELIRLCNNVECFEYEGYIFFGNRGDIVLRYVRENPSAKFFIWLKDNIHYMGSHNIDTDIVPDWPKPYIVQPHRLTFREIETAHGFPLLWASLECYSDPNWKVQQDNIIRKRLESIKPFIVMNEWPECVNFAPRYSKEYEYNHTIRAEITDQHAKDVSSRPQTNGIREWADATAKAIEWVRAANKKKQSIKVWIDEQLWYDTDTVKKAMKDAVATRNQRTEAQMLFITPTDRRAQRDSLRELLAKDNDFGTRVKFDNHTQLQFDGYTRTIDDFGGFRVFHRQLMVHEKIIFEVLVNGYGFDIFQPTSDETSTVIIPKENYNNLKAALSACKK